MVHLRAHVEGVHNNIRRHNCEECGDAFTRNANLERHIIDMHENVRRYVCKECGYAAKQKAHLNRHILRTHNKQEVHDMKQPE